MAKEDFNDDKIDAGELSSGHTVTALYEIIPVGQKGWLNDSRYAQNKTKSGKNSEYAFLNIRYKLPNQSKSILMTQPIAVASRPLNQANVDTKFAIAVAAYGQQLRGGQYNASMGWNDILNLAQAGKQSDPYGLKAEFIDLVKKAKSLRGDQTKALQINKVA